MMNRVKECASILLAFNFISFYLDACLISNVDFISKNVIQLRLNESQSPNCHFVVTTESQCNSSEGVFFNEVVLLQNKSATLWLNGSLGSSLNITICSRTADTLLNTEFTQIYQTTANDGIPPFFRESYFTQKGMRAKLYPFHNSWIHAYSSRDKIKYTCIFTENITEKRLKWCKVEGNCSEHSIAKGQNEIKLEVTSPNGFEGTYYAILENDYGKTQTPKSTWKMAFQNRDTERVVLSHEEGDQVTMPCNIQSSIPKVDPSSVLWNQMTDGGMIYLSENEGMVKSLDGSLVVLDASPAMNGTYSCEVRNEVLGETMLDNPTLLIVTPKEASGGLPAPRAVKSLNVGHKDTAFTVTKNLAILQCLFRGRPEPRVLWYKGDFTIPLHAREKYELHDGNMTLHIKDVKKEDDGSYKCVASNGIGSEDYKMIRLIVQEPPYFLERMDPQRVTEGEDVTFHCKYKGDPRPTSIWFVNGTAVDNSDKISISETSIGSELTLFGVTENSTASIQCLATNPHGEINEYSYMKVFKPTKIMSLAVVESAEDIARNTANKTLVCQARTDSRTNLYVEWFVNDTKISSENDRPFEAKNSICNFKSSKNELLASCFDVNIPMEIVCKASNGISTSKRSYKIGVSLPSSATSKEENFFLEGNSWLKYTAFSVGAGFVVLAIFAAVLAIHKSRHRAKKVEISQSQMSVLGSHFRPSTSDESSTSQGVSPHLKKDLINIISSLLIPRSSLEMKKCIGNGHFGRVYLAALVHGRQISEIVAVKTMKYKAEESEMVELFLKEAVLMKDFQHQHVLGIRGITFAEDATPMVVLPYMANGDLRNYILNPALNITILNLLIMGMQVACGMDYLSKHHFVHRDLAARNCMVNDNGVVKIADFGMSRQLISCDYYRVENGKDPVPIRWMAPECLEAKIFTTKSDVWAYGVLLWELMTRGAVPYPDAENWQVASLIQNGCLLRQPPFCPNVVYSMMTRCWIQESNNRPTFEQLLVEMEAVINVVRPEVRRDSASYNSVFGSE